jgi:hypothetical protein
MQSNYIELNKKREIGDIITDTFKFLRKNLKVLYPILLKTLLIPFILLIVAVIFYSVATSELTSAIYIMDSIGNNPAAIIIGLLVLLVTGMVYTGLLHGSIAEYMKEYHASNGNPNTETVLRQIKEKTTSYITLAFTNLLYVFGFPIIIMVLGIIFIGGSFSFLGGLIIIAAFVYIIYLYTRYTIIFPSLAHKKNAVTESFSTSSKLVKEEWWNTFLTLFLLGLITGAISFVFQLPGAIYTISKEFVAPGEFSVVDASTDWILVIFQTLSSAVSYLLYIILAVATNFIYFNLSERKNQTGSMERINSIGRSDEV